MRKRAAIGCGVAAAIAFVVIIGAVIAGFRSVDWGPPARGMASANDLRPLPEGVEVVGEQVGENGSCGGNGKGWHQCQRLLRVRMTGKSEAELARLLADHYRTLGHEMVDQSPGSGAWYGPVGCPPGESLCLYIEEPTDQSDWPDSIEHLRDRPRPGDVDVVARTWSYYI
jgi:hypothetical protein